MFQQKLEDYFHSVDPAVSLCKQCNERKLVLDVSLSSANTYRCLLRVECASCPLTWSIVLPELHVVSRTSWSALQAKVPKAEGQVVSSGPLKIPFTAGAIRIVRCWETRAVDHPHTTYVGSTTGGCEGKDENKWKRLLTFFYLKNVTTVHIYDFQQITSRAIKQIILN